MGRGRVGMGWVCGKEGNGIQKKAGRNGEAQDQVCGVWYVCVWEVGVWGVGKERRRQTEGE